MDNKFVRCAEPDDPDRCQGVCKSGQCPYKKEPGLEYCPMHMASGKTGLEKKAMRNYRLGKHQLRVEEFADNDQVKSLREEVGITRMLLEEIVNRCADANDLLMYSNKISQLVGQIEKLVVSCDRLERSTGMLLDKTRVTHLADVIINIIGMHITDPEALPQISHQILAEIIGVESTPITQQ